MGNYPNDGGAEETDQKCEIVEFIPITTIDVIGIYAHSGADGNLTTMSRIRVIWNCRVCL